MSVRYIIEGNLAVKESVTRSSAVPLERVLENLTAYQPLDIFPTPRNLRSISIKPRENMQLEARIIVGHDPMQRRITHKNCPASSHRAQPQNYLLQFPYGIFWFHLYGNRLSGVEGDSIVWNPQAWGYVWMKEPFSDLEQQGWTPKMPNIFGDSRICFGHNSVSGSLPLGHFVDQSVNTFWTSEFNQDLSNLTPYGSMREWEAAGEADWHQWDMWNNRAATLRDKFSRFDEGIEWQTPVPDSAGTPIPALPMYNTFDNLERWLNGLTPEQAERLRTTFEVTRSNESE